MSTETRTCTVCAGKGRDRPMKSHLRHLHELDEGEEFQMYGGHLDRITGGRAYIRTGGSDQTVSPTMEVMPVRTHEANGAAALHMLRDRLDAPWFHDVIREARPGANERGAQTDDELAECIAVAVEEEISTILLGDDKPADEAPRIEFTLPGKAAEAIQIDAQSKWPDTTFTVRKRGRGYQYVVETTPADADKMLQDCRDRAHSGGWDQPAAYAQACKRSIPRIEEALDAA